MAIYYIDPHTTTNGTGTWASPWSFAGSSRTGLISGDEIRIKGVALTSLLTATVYTATWSSTASPTQVTLTAGGGLGADFAAGSIVYLPDYDLFVKINSVSGNNLITANINFPIPDSTVTTVTLRKVDTTTYPVSTTGAVGYLVNVSMQNLTITDGWIDATTRVTDGTVKTIIHSAVTGIFTLNLITLASYGHSISLLNTFISGGSAANGGLQLYLLASGSSISIGQVQGATGSGFACTTTVNSIANTTIYVKNSNLVNLISNNYLSGSNITLTVDNVYVMNMANFFTASGTYKTVDNFTLNIGNMYVTSGTTLLTLYQVKEFTINFNGLIDQAANSALARIFSLGQGPLKVKFGASFQYMYNKKATTQNTIAGLISSIYTSVLTNPVIVPEVDIPPGWTLTLTKLTSTIDLSSGANMQQTRKIASVHNIIFPDNTYTSQLTLQLGTNTNIRLSYRDNSSPPTEYLNVPTGMINSNIAATNAPQVSYDATVYRSSAPSLQSYLATKTTSYWQVTVGSSGTVHKYKASKPIKIPVTSGVSYTVTGYIRTDDTSYVNGDCSVSIVIADADVVSQNMTTACINAWEQFTLTFTSTITGEAHLCWNMFYENGAKSYWLDDLTIS